MHKWQEYATEKKTATENGSLHAIFEYRPKQSLLIGQLIGLREHSFTPHPITILSY
jgi:hypothetical protein